MKISKLLAGLVIAAFSATAFAQSPIIIKFSHVVAQDTPKGNSAKVSVVQRDLRK